MSNAKLHRTGSLKNETAGTAQPRKCLIVGRPSTSQWSGLGMRLGILWHVNDDCDVRVDMFFVLVMVLRGHSAGCGWIVCVVSLAANHCSVDLDIYAYTCQVAQ